MTDLPPALPPEMWRDALRNELWRVEIGQGIMRDTLAGRKTPFLERPDHALAALALHGQPFGFTHEDVEMVREMTRGLVLLATQAAGYVGRDIKQPSDTLTDAANSLAARISALLPPLEGG